MRRAIMAADRVLEGAGMLCGRARKFLRGEAPPTVLEVDWRLGDEIMALPCFEAYKLAHPGRRLVARVRFPELLAGNPHVDELNPARVEAERWIVLRGERPGVARREVLEGLSGLRLEGIAPRVYLSEEERATPPSPWLAAGGGGPRVLIHARASQACKHWPDERWRVLSARLTKHGCRVAEVGVGQPVLEGEVSLVGRTSVRELARALAHAEVLVGDDSGPLHLALAVGTRTVGVFAATRSDLLYAGSPLFTPVTSQAECRFCWSRWELAYPSGRCPRPHHECVEDVTVEAVMAAILGHIDAGR